MLQMASHHHHCLHPPPITTPYCHPCCCNCTPSPPPPPPPVADPLLQSIASHLLHHHPPPPSHPHPHPPHTHQPEHHPPHKIHNHKQKHHSRKYRPRRESDEEEEEEERTLPIVSSLLRRIAALESSLRHSSPAPFSLRNTAARTIQTHFRAYLVRRSRTLRQLKDLAFIKSALNILKSTLSSSTHVDCHALSQETMGLLVKLESIQGGDPMIRDGKRSISRELIRFLEFIDEVSLKRHVLYSSRAVKNVGFGKNGAKSRVSLGGQRKRNVDSGGSGGDERKALEQLRNRVRKIEELSRVYEEEEEEEENVVGGKKGLPGNGNRGVSQNRVGGLVKRQVEVQPKAKKNVTFVENGNVYRIIRSRDGPGSSGDSDSIDGSDLVDAERELMKNICREVEEIGISPKETLEDDHEEDGTEETESSEVSGDDEKDPRGNARARDDEYEIRKQLDQDEDDGGFTFSAPLPVKMEARADLMNKKQPVRQ